MSWSFCWLFFSLAVFVVPSSKSLVGLVALACWAVLPLVVRGTTARKRYYRPQRGTTAEGRDLRVKLRQGEVSSPPYPFASPPLSSSSLQPPLAAGGLRRISVSGASLSISFGGVDPHLVLLPWMPVLPPFLLSFCLVFRFCFLGAMVVASLDFWLNLGLSRLEKATRLS